MIENPYLSASGVFVIKTVFDLFIGAVVLRLLLQWARADFRNPVSQFLVKITNPVIIPLRRIVPGVGGIDTASVMVVLILQVTKVWLIHMIAAQSPSIAGLLMLALADFVEFMISIYTITIILQVILSWVGPRTPNPINGPLHALNEPLLTPLRRIIPTISGFDLTPVVLLLLFHLMRILVVAPLTDIGRGLG